MRHKLFICHASADKADFVLELAAALKADFEVWIDAEQVTVGDSLYQKINKGLADADYAVVVISPVFLGKKWPLAELGTLFALEETNRKLILPIWKDIERDTIRRECPMLLDRFAALSSDGIPNIVGQIKQAVSASERTRQIAHTENLALAFKAFIDTAESRNQAERLLVSPEGARLLLQEFSRLETTLKDKLAAIQSGTGVHKFDVRRSQQFNEIHVTFLSVVLSICLDKIAINSASLATLHYAFFEIGKLREFGQRDEPTKLESQTLYPYFRNANEVVWRPRTSSQELISTDQLLVGLIERFLGHLKKREQRG
jgi:hypothetical protein